MEDVSVSVAAGRLGIGQQAVRDLIGSGALPARRAGRRTWLIDAADLRRFARRSRSAGRPLSPRSCWAALALAGGWEPPPMSRSERARARERVAGMARMPAHSLDGRARAVALFGHPGVLQALGDDPRLVLGGVSAAAAHGADIVAPGRVEAYLRADDLEAVRADYALDDAPEAEANVVLRVPQIPWPLPERAIAPAVVVAWDLIDSDEDRSARAGRALLEAVLVEPAP
jgi:excisionase family DNA binding protein